LHKKFSYENKPNGVREVLNVNGELISRKKEKKE
jgi:hypothetical protein